MVFYYGFLLLGGVLVFVALAHIVYQKRSSVSMISWMLFIVFLPHIAAPLYFLIGIRKRDPQKHKNFLSFSRIDTDEDYRLDDTEHAIAAILEKNGIPPATRANELELITGDVAAYRVLMDAVGCGDRTDRDSDICFCF